jgi:hypothetical protein
MERNANTNLDSRIRGNDNTEYEDDNTEERPGFRVKPGMTEKGAAELERGAE